MKKIFTLLSMVMFLFAVTANAQSRKTWDFTKGVSDATRAQLDADATWTKTLDSDGETTTTWTTSFFANGELTAGGQKIKELEGLSFSDFSADNAVGYYGTKIRIQKTATITLPALTTGQKIQIVAQSANSTATDRGFVFENAVNAAGESTILVPGPDGAATINLTVVADGVVAMKTGVSGAASGIEILSIIIDEGDKNIKKWDFSAWSDATKAQVLAAADWTKAESASKEYITGDEIRWNLETNFDANDDLTAGGTAIAELKGLRHSNLGAYGLGIAFDYQTTLDGNDWGPFNSGSYLWITGATSTITVPNVKAGSTLKLGVESHNPTNARGITVSVNGVAVGTAPTTMEYNEFEYAIPAGSDEYVDVTLQATKGLHLYFIEAEVKDETVVDKNPRLGDATYSVKNGSFINPSSTGFTMTFPKAVNIDPTATITLEGFFGPVELGDLAFEDCVFDGVEGILDGGFTFAFTDFPCAEAGMQENTAYEFYITKLTIDGYEALNLEAAEGEKLFPLSFVTTGPGIETTREWQFTTTVEDAEAIAASVNNGLGLWVASSKGRYSVSTNMFVNGNQQILIDENTPLRVTDGLLFTMGTDKDILIGTPAHNGVDAATSAGGNNGKLQLGGGSPELIIPSCNAGDEVTITALWSTTNKGIITITNGTAEDGTNTIQLTKSAADYKIKVTDNGNLTLKSNSVVYQAISVFPSTIEKKQVKYTVNAVDSEGKVLKTIAEGEAMTNDNIEIPYSYYVTDAEGNVYTCGAPGTQFTQTFNILSDTTFVINYKTTTIKNAVFCSEAEDIAGTTLLTTGNMLVRASNQKAAYAENDIVLVTLQPGSYKITAGLFDVKPISYVAQFVLGNAAATDAPILLSSTADNLSIVESDLFEVKEATTLIWVAGGAENKGIDFIAVYPSDDAPEPEDPDGISDVNASAKDSVKAKTVVKDGRIVIESVNGTYTVAGAKIK